MATSPHEGVILYDVEELSEQDPVDTVLVRDEVISSALHKADEAGQVRVAWPSLNSSLITPDSYMQTFDDLEGLAISEGLVATATVRAWYPFPFEVPHFPKIRADGSGYRLRVTVDGASSVGGDRVDFGVTVVPWSRKLQDASDPLVWGTTTSNSPATISWDGGVTYVDVPSSAMGEAAALEGPWWTLDDVGGSRITMPAPVLGIVVVGRSWVVSGGVPRLYSVEVADYVGP